MGEARLRFPFPSISGDNFISRGSAGQVFVISENLVIKCPTLFDNPAPEQSQESKESIQKIEHEKSVYRVLMRYPHENIVRAISCAPEGIIMQRLKCTLRSRLSSDSIAQIGLEIQSQWIQQLASAVEWLERLGYAHGDLRPANILLDAEDTIKIADFDSTVHFGEELLVTTLPFCKLESDYEAPIASAVSEQFSVGSCIYNIRTGFEPYHDIDGPVMAQKLVNNEFPNTSDDLLFGNIILGCWRGCYSSIRELRQALPVHSLDIEDTLRDGVERGTPGDVSDATDPIYQSLNPEVMAFLLANRKTPGV